MLIHNGVKLCKIFILKRVYISGVDRAMFWIETKQCLKPELSFYIIFFFFNFTGAGPNGRTEFIAFIC